MAPSYGTWIYVIQVGVPHQLLGEQIHPWCLYIIITQQHRYLLGNSLPTRTVGPTKFQLFSIIFTRWI